jgi:hypothetical protein
VSDAIDQNRTFSVRDAIVFQREACDRMGAPLYARLLGGVEDDYDRGGTSASLLDGRSERPLHDAIPLRLLGGVHRLVLGGRAPELAEFYPSAGGHSTGDPVPPFLAVLDGHRAELETRMGQGVQTNEVGRAALLAPGFALLARRTGLPLHLREVGSSAGLLLRWDHYRYSAGGAVLGDPQSPLSFEAVYLPPGPDLSGAVHVADRRGCDISPIDGTTDDGRLALLSFVWPDQLARFERLRTALDLAAVHPVQVDRADAGEWVAEQVRELPAARATVVFHSIVLQYLTKDSRRAMKAALHEAGARASAHAPLAWLRMEPAGGSHAELRLTSWPGGEEELLATSGFHGENIRWGADHVEDAAAGP